MGPSPWTPHSGSSGTHPQPSTSRPLGSDKKCLCPSSGELAQQRFQAPSTSTLRPARCPAKLHQAEGPAGCSECPCCMDWCRHAEDSVPPHTAATQVVAITVNLATLGRLEAIVPAPGEKWEPQLCGCESPRSSQLITAQLHTVVCSGGLGGGRALTCVPCSQCV